MYQTVIERGQAEANDRIIDYLKPRISGRWLDIGCNGGWLLSEVPGGVGVEASEIVALRAIRRGVSVVLAMAECLPFADGEFETAVLSCVLEQTADWRVALAEARRVAKRVIGVNPIPCASPWGYCGQWVKSVISPKEMPGVTVQIDPARYYFEIT